MFGGGLSHWMLSPPACLTPTQSLLGLCLRLLHEACNCCCSWSTYSSLVPAWCCQHRVDLLPEMTTGNQPAAAAFTHSWLPHSNCCQCDSTSDMCCNVMHRPLTPLGPRLPRPVGDDESSTSCQGHSQILQALCRGWGSHPAGTWAIQAGCGQWQLSRAAVQPLYNPGSRGGSTGEAAERQWHV